MMKIRISYERPEELEAVRRLLAPVIKSCKVSGNQEGRYRKAYIEGRESIRADHTEQRTKPGGAARNGKEGRDCFGESQKKI